MCQLVVVKVSNLEFLIQFIQRFSRFFFHADRGNHDILKEGYGRILGILKAKEPTRVLKITPQQAK